MEPSDPSADEGSNKKRYGGSFTETSGYWGECRYALLVFVPYIHMGRTQKGFEWLGLDFLVDSELHVWLLEANISPDLSYGDDIRRDLVPRAVRDTLHCKYCAID